MMMFGYSVVMGWSLAQVCGSDAGTGGMCSIGERGATMLSSSMIVSRDDGCTCFSNGVGVGMKGGCSGSIVWVGASSGGIRVTGAIVSVGVSFVLVDCRPWRLACMCPW